MKKIFTLVFALVLTLIFSFGSSTSSYAIENNTLDKYKLLDPYQKVMEKLNKELGSTFYVEENNQESFYNNVKDMTSSEFEKLLRNEYKEFTEASKTDSDAMTDIPQESLITPYYIREGITQNFSLSYNSTMYLSSTVFSTTGTSGTFKYESINSLGTKWPSGFTGFHWQVDTKSYSLSSDSKNCTVSLTGHPEDANGVSLAYYLTAKKTFYAN